MKVLKKSRRRRWTTRDSMAAYGLDGWAKDYLKVSPNGHLCISLAHQYGKRKQTVDLKEAIDRLAEARLSQPVLLRFPQVLRERVKALHHDFNGAIAKTSYPGRYQAVFPVKVNQENATVGEVLKAGAEFHCGLEVGSKGELILALATLKDPRAYLVCNGRKDSDFVEVALLGQRLGLSVILVIESPQEVPLIAHWAIILGLKPRLGIRARVPVQVTGAFAHSSGEQSFFGLNFHQMDCVLEALREHDLLDCLELFHCHQASQIPDLVSVERSIAFAARIYVEIRKKWCPNLRIMDIGGGLAVDYDSSQSAAGASRDYSNADYCHAVVAELKRVLDETPEIEAPILMSESGRAVTAHASALVVPIVETAAPLPSQNEVGQILGAAGEKLLRISTELAEGNLARSINQARSIQNQCREDFLRRQLDLDQLTQVDRLAGGVFTQALRISSQMDQPPREAESLTEQMRHFYYGSFSIFQSLADSWAIGQLFPVVPLQRLHEEPLIKASIVDLTCDSDGAINRFSSAGAPRNYLPVHEVSEQETYYVGIFLTGAYQEILGGPHNLFGKPLVVDLTVQKGKPRAEVVRSGQSVADLAGIVGYEIAELDKGFRKLIARAAPHTVCDEDKRRIAKAFRRVLQGTSYVNQERRPR